MAKIYTHQQYEPRHNPSNCVRIRGGISPLVCSLRTIMIETNHSLKDEENYIEYRKQAEEEINAKLPENSQVEEKSLADIIIELKATAQYLKDLINE